MTLVSACWTIRYAVRSPAGGRCWAGPQTFLDGLAAGLPFGVEHGPCGVRRGLQRLGSTAALRHAEQDQHGEQRRLEETVAARLGDRLAVLKQREPGRGEHRHARR